MKLNNILNSINPIECGASSLLDREFIYQFWYDTYHNEMKRNSSDLDHKNKVIKDSLEPKSTIIYYKLKDQVVATIRASKHNELLNSSYNNFTDAIKTNNYLFVTKFMVNNKFRKLGIGSHLIKCIESHARKMQVSEIYLDCNDYMIPYFSKLGFKMVINNAVESKHYGSVFLMSKEIK